MVAGAPHLQLHAAVLFARNTLFVLTFLRGIQLPAMVG